MEDSDTQDSTAVLVCMHALLLTHHHHHYIAWLPADRKMMNEMSCLGVCFFQSSE